MGNTSTALPVHGNEHYRISPARNISASTYIRTCAYSQEFQTQARKADAQYKTEMMESFLQLYTTKVYTLPGALLSLEDNRNLSFRTCIQMCPLSVSTVT